MADSRSFGYHCSCVMFERYGLTPPSFELYVQMTDYMAFYRQHGLPQSVTREELNDVWDDTFVTAKHLVVLREGAHEVLQACRGRGMATAVVSGNTEATLGHSIVHFGMSGLLHHWHAAAHSKELALREVLDLLGFAPEEAFYVGDTHEDIVAAKAAGMTAIGIEGGFQSAVRLQKAKPDHCIASLGELFPLLGLEPVLHSG